MTRAEQLAKISKDLMLGEAFYGMFLMTLNKRWDNRIQTAGVGQNGINFQLLLSEQFWDEQTDKQRLQLLKHELLHIGFFHITDFKHQTNHELSNTAQDLEINQYLDRDHMPGKGGVHIDMYPELNLEEKKGCNYYYDKLMQGAQKGNCPNLNAQLAAAAAGEGTCEMTIDGQQQTVDLPDHSSREELENADEATTRLLKKQTEHILTEVADAVVKSRGTVPGEFTEIIRRIQEVEPPKFDWKAYLRRFTGGSTKIFTKKIRRKYNKRYEDNPGLKIKPKRHILVAIDTSGSVSSKELKEFLNEIYHIQKTGTEITVAQCDTSIRSIAPYKHTADFQIHGRGGTSFDPVLDYYNENTHKYTCLVYLTDGEAPAPAKARGRMLWVLSSQSTENTELIGPQIVLN